MGLERGERRGLEDFQEIHDEWRYAVNNGVMQDLSMETLTFRNTQGMRALPMRRLGSFLPGDGLGGAGSHWNGMTVARRGRSHGGFAPLIPDMPEAEPPLSVRCP